MTILTESMSMGEKFLNTFAITILGMVVVYIVLVIIAYSLELLKVLFGEKPKKTVSEEYAEVTSDIEEKKINNTGEDIELIVLITAAIAAFEGTSGENVIVRSIKELPYDKNIWAAAGRQQLMSANNIIVKRR